MRGRCDAAGLGTLLLAGACVFWAFDALPFQDLPGHAGFIALRHRFADWTELQPYYVLAPRIGGYSLYRFLGELLAGPLGAVRATRALATVAFLALPAALAWARARLHGDAPRTAAYLGVALGFGFPTLLGFTGFLLGIAALVVAMTMWLELLDAAGAGRETLRRELWLASAALFVLVAHGGVFILFVGLAAVTAASATPGRLSRVARLRALIPALALAAWSAWAERASALPPGSVDARNPPLVAYYEGILPKVSLLFTTTLLTRTGIDLVVAAVLWGVLAAAVVATARGASSARTRALLAALAFSAVAFFALPHAVGWLAFVDGRVVPVIAVVAMMTVDRGSLGPTLSRAFEAAPRVAAGLMVSLALTASHVFQAEAAGWREVIARIPAGARVLNMPIEPDSRVFTAHPFIHYDKLALADRPVLVSDAWFHQGTGLYPTAENPSDRLPASYVPSDLREVRWEDYRLEDWDYVLVRLKPESAAPDVPRSLALDAHEGGWWLFRTSRSVEADP